VRSIRSAPHLRVNLSSDEMLVPNTYPLVGSKSALVSDLTLIATPEPTFPIRLTVSWPLRIDTVGYTLTFYSWRCICRSARHEENR
jgi:hypothetical protein